MQAIQVKADGSFAYENVEDPVISNGTVRIAVKAAGVNRADLLQAKGNYPPPEGTTNIMGLEIAGTIEAIGENVKQWQVGDSVMALVPGGGYATKVVAPTSMLIAIPEEWDFMQAAAVPEAIYTAYLNLWYLARLSEEETVLIHAGAGGIGSTAIQLAKQYGAYVITTAGSDDKVQFCKELGADLALNYRLHELKASITAYAPLGLDVVLDPIGSTNYSELHTSLLKGHGQWLLIGLLGSAKAEIKMVHILTKNLLLKGSTLRYRSLDFKIQLTQLIKRDVLPLYQRGSLQPCVDQVFAMKDAGKAHNHLLQNKTKGKAILRP